MSTYTVRQLAALAGVSVRTLHHYDRIGLLQPAGRSDAGYRLYGRAELLRLQQILFYRELDVPLDRIRNLLDDPGFDRIEALRSHRRSLQERIDRLRTLLGTVDTTIQQLQEPDMTITDADLYKGFPHDQVEDIRDEARARYGADAVRESEEKLRKLSKADLDAFKQEGDDLSRALADLIHESPDSPAVQKAVARHHAWVSFFYPCPADRYRGLADLYVQDDRFRATYDKYAPGLAAFLSAAMKHYADTELAD